MTQELAQNELLSKVNALIQEWRIILRLEHWDVRAKIVHPSEIAGRQATITFNSCNGLATIQLADPAILDPPEMWADFYKLEKVIAHELLHLMLVGMEDIWAHVMEELSPSARNIADKQWEIASEQLVELLANILVSLKGGDKDQKV
jgi:hypothetical protein